VEARSATLAGIVTSDVEMETVEMGTVTAMAETEPMLV
jgi:co-chaperonin GroES (HSP10)